MKKILTVALLGLLILSCKKSSESPSKSKENLLTQKEWVVTAIRTQKNTEAWKDDFSTNQPCEKDNRVIFENDGKYNITEGPTKCNASDPQIYFQDESWAFTDNKNKLTLSHKGGYEFTILQLDETTLKILEEYSLSGDNHKEETTFSHP